MNATVVFWQGFVVGLGALALRMFGYVEEAFVYAVCVLLAADLVWLASQRARKRLDFGMGLGDPRERERIIGSFFAVAVVQLGQSLPRLNGWGGFIHVGSHEGLVLTMVLIALSAATTIYLSSLIDWFYVRPHLVTSFAPRSPTRSWRLVTRVRLVHRLLAVLGVLGACTAIVGLAANAWVSEPLGDNTAGAIAAVATIIAGYYFARAAPLVALATNPSVQICDVVELAEEFNMPACDPRKYFVVDIGWEGVKLVELPETRDGTYLLEPHDPHYDRMVDVGDITKLVRRRMPIAAT